MSDERTAAGGGEGTVRIVGIDIGFGFTKVTSGDTDRIFKSIYGDARQIQFREQFMGAPGSEGALHLEIGNRSFFVGELAERQSDLRAFTLDQDQFIGEMARVLAIAGLLQVGERNTTVRVVTGLPISYYRRHREQLATHLKGQHAANVIDSSGRKIAVSSTVTHVRVIPQPFGSYFSTLLNDGGDVVDRAAAQEKIGVIDVGFCTTDFTIADKTRYSERGSKTSDTGMSRAFETVAARVRELTGIDVELYRLYEAVDRGNIKVRGRLIDLKPVVEEAYDALAAAIATECERVWTHDWDIDRILVTGGGGAALAPYLKNRIPGDLRLPPAGQDARYSNVRGYWRYGKNLWGRGT